MGGGSRESVTKCHVGERGVLIKGHVTFFDIFSHILFFLMALEGKFKIFFHTEGRGVEQCHQMTHGGRGSKISPKSVAYF